MCIVYVISYSLFMASYLAVTPTNQCRRTPSSSTPNPTALRRWRGLGTIRKSSCTCTLAWNHVSRSTTVPTRSTCGSSLSHTYTPSTRSHQVSRPPAPPPRYLRQTRHHGLPECQPTLRGPSPHLSPLRHRMQTKIRTTTNHSWWSSVTTLQSWVSPSLLEHLCSFSTSWPSLHSTTRRTSGGTTGIGVEALSVPTLPVNWHPYLMRSSCHCRWSVVSWSVSAHLSWGAAVRLTTP